MKRVRSSSSLPIRKRARFTKAGTRRSFLEPELKFYDTSLVGDTLLAGSAANNGEHDPAAVDCISAPAQGDGESERDGKKCIVTSATVQGYINIPAQANQTAGDASCEVMVCLVRDSQTNGAQYNSEEVFTNPGASTATGTSVLRNLKYSSRFSVLKTIRLQFDQPNMAYDGTNVEQGGCQKSFSLYSAMKMPVNFTSTSAGVAGVMDNSLHVLAFTNNTDLAPTISYNARVRFLG